MAINLGSMLYSPVYNVHARPITVTPAVSQPGQPDYTGRGCFKSRPIDVMVENNVISDAQTVVYIIEQEFPVPPLQGDTILVPASLDLPSKGSFVVADTDSNGLGETVLTLRAVVVTKP